MQLALGRLKTFAAHLQAYKRNLEKGKVELAREKIKWRGKLEKEKRAAEASAASIVMGLAPTASDPTRDAHRAVGPGAGTGVGAGAAGGDGGALGSFLARGPGMHMQGMEGAPGVRQAVTPSSTDVWYGAMALQASQRATDAAVALALNDDQLPQEDVEVSSSEVCCRVLLCPLFLSLPVR